MRSRINQPSIGSRFLLNSLIYRGLRHDYVFYSEPYEHNGTTYAPGYYDEYGDRHDNIVFENSDGSKTLMMTCEYCGTITKLDRKEGDIPCCSKCGAPLNLKNAEKDNIRSAETINQRTNQSFQENEKQYEIDGYEKRDRAGCTILAVVAIVVFIPILFYLILLLEPKNLSSRNQSEPIQIISSTSGTTYNTNKRQIRLKQNVDGSYSVAGNSESADKILRWDADTETYYDAATDTYIWYHDDWYPDYPAVWQYWVEGVSSEYGDYGWMEYDNGQWYIEVRDNKWDTYTGDTSSFWYISETNIQ